jgi:hypothetical protein
MLIFFQKYKVVDNQFMTKENIENTADVFPRYDVMCCCTSEYSVSTGTAKLDTETCSGHGMPKVLRKKISNSSDWLLCYW